MNIYLVYGFCFESIFSLGIFFEDIFSLGDFFEDIFSLGDIFFEAIFSLGFFKYIFNLRIFFGIYI